MTIAEAEDKYRRYGLCFRITRAKSGIGYDVKPFSTDAVSEPTTFAVCCEFQGRDGNAPWIEVNSRTVSFRSHADGKAQDDRACPWLMTYLKAICVELLNHTRDMIEKEDANEDWVRKAASDPRCSDEAIKTVLDLRFGENRVGYDPSDIGSNREAVSKDWTLVTGGSMSAGEWENAKRAHAIQPAGKLFPTNLEGKVPDKTYSRNEWTPEMLAYAKFVEGVSPALVGHKVTVEYIRDQQMVCGQFFDTHFVVNLAKHSVGNRQQNIELMLHELAHSVVRSNDHLVHEFYETVGRLGAKLALLAVEKPELFEDESLMIVQ